MICPTTIVLAMLTTLAQAETIRVVPADALADAPVRIEIAGLRPKQSAIVRAFANDASGAQWQSWAGFIADAAGRVDVAATAPIHGTYAGIDAMGLFWSMDSAGEKHGRQRFDTTGLDHFEVRFHVEISGKAVAE